MQYQKSKVGEHQPEPWYVTSSDDEWGVYLIEDADGYSPRDVEKASTDEANANRISVCVNACRNLMKPECLKYILHHALELAKNPFDPNHQEGLKKSFLNAGFTAYVEEDGEAEAEAGNDSVTF